MIYPPAIDINGNIISEGFLGNQSKIISVDNTGNLNWQEVYFMPSTPASIGLDNTIYLGGRSGSMGNFLPKVRAYSSEGSVIWSYPVPDEFLEVTTSVAIGENGNLLFGTSSIISENGTLFALDALGNLLWSNLYNGEIYSTPAIADNGLIYFGCYNGYFYVIHPDGSEKWSINTESGLATSPVIANNGIIYFTTENGFLYAVYGENGGLANSPWPMVQHDPKHTSSVDSLPVFIDEKDMPANGLKKLFAVPNPFNHKTIIQWKSNYPTEAKIMIFDLPGNEVFSYKFSCKKGINNFVWDGTGKGGGEVKPGVYICTLLFCEKTSCIKLIKK
jgi:outer membrane protein assembly factor BamB